MEKEGRSEDLNPDPQELEKEEGITVTSEYLRVVTTNEHARQIINQISQLNEYNSRGVVPWALKTIDGVRGDYNGDIRLRDGDMVRMLINPMSDDEVELHFGGGGNSTPTEKFVEELLPIVKS